MDLAQLCSILEACLSPEEQIRKAAEAALNQASTNPGQAVSLLRVAAEDSVHAAVRQVAAISFKNLVKRHWELPESSSTTYKLQEQDKQVVRDNLLESLIRAPHNIQTQLGEVLKSIVYEDYPEKWPGLLPALCNNLVSQEQARVHGALYALRIVTRKYEFRDEEERGPLAQILSTTFPALLHIFQQLLAAPVVTPEVATYIKLVCKTYWSATYMGIPDILLQPEQFSGWMQCLHAMIVKSLPLEQQPSDLEDRKACPWWKAKKWALHIGYRLYTRYGNPKMTSEGNDRRFAELWAAQCSTQFLDAHVQLVAAMANGQYTSPRATNLLFQYLSHAVGQKDAYKHLREHWDNILHNVAFPLMCFNDEDADLWENDPHEYIRKGYDILEDMYNPKTAASNFAHDLCAKKKAHLDRFMSEVVLGSLTAYTQAAAAGAATQVHARRMDGAMLAIGVMNDLLKNKSPYKEQLGPMLVNFVLPSFKSPFGHLRSKASWVAGTFCDAEFTDGKGQGASYGHLFQQVASCLSDPELPVRVDSVVALRSFIEEAEDTEALKAILPQLLNSIFQLMGEVDNEDLVFSLEAIVEKFGEDIAPYAQQMVQQLSAAFWKYASEDDEDGDDDDDTAGLAAYGCLRTINTLLESMSSLTHMYPVLEEMLFPIMQKHLSPEGQDIIEEVLEMLAYFTFYSPSISPRMWSLWPALHTCLVSWGIDFWENLLVPLDNMISRDTPRFVTSKDPDYLASVFQMAQHSLTGDFDERDVVSAAKLMEVVLQNCRGSVDAWVGPYVQLALGKLANCENRTLKDSLVCVVANALYYNAGLALSALQATGGLAQFFAGWFSMIFASKKGGNKCKHFRRMHDKKVCILGLLSLLSCPDAALPAEVASGMPQVVAGALRLLAALKEQQEEEEKMKAAEGDEDEDDDDEDDGLDQDWGNDDEDDEEEEAGPEDFKARIRKQAQDLFGDGDDDSDDEWTEDEEVQTPIDPVDPYVLFADTLGSLAASNPGRHQQLTAVMDSNAAAAVQQMVQYAAERRQAQAQAKSS